MKCHHATRIVCVIAITFQGGGKAAARGREISRGLECRVPGLTCLQMGSASAHRRVGTWARKKSSPSLVSERAWR